MSYATQSWTSRLSKLGDESENKFLEVAEQYVGLDPSGSPCAVRAGLLRPPFSIMNLSTRERGRPDFLTPIGFVECKGLGRDQLLKMKRADLDVLSFWDSIEPVHIFVWDSHEQRHALRNLLWITTLIDRGKSELGYFPENKAYFGIHMNDFVGSRNWLK